MKARSVHSIISCSPYERIACVMNEDVIRCGNVTRYQIYKFINL